MNEEKNIEELISIIDPDKTQCPGCGYWGDKDEIPNIYCKDCIEGFDTDLDSNGIFIPQFSINEKPLTQKELANQAIMKQYLVKVNSEDFGKIVDRIDQNIIKFLTDSVKE